MLFSAKTIYGLDIGSGSVKLVELVKRRGFYELARGRVIPIDQWGAGKEDGTKNALLRLFEEEKIKRGLVGVAVTGQSAFVRYLKLPKVGQKRISQIIRYEAAQQVPFAIEDVCWDYQMLGSSAESQTEVDVMLVAGKKDIVTGLIELAHGANLEIEFIDATPLAMFNAYCFAAEPGHGSIILDMGCSTTNIIFTNGTQMWTRSVPIAGRNITKSLSTNLKISMEEAEKLKIEEGVLLVGASPEEEARPRAREISRATGLVLTDILTEVSRSLTFYRSQSPDTEFDSVYITGGTSRIKNIDKFFEKNLGVGKARIDLFEKIKPSPAITARAEDIGSMIGVALGEALRGLTKCEIEINLLPEEQIKAKEFRKKQFYIFVSGIVATLILATSGFFLKQGAAIDVQALGTLKQEEQSLRDLETDFKGALGEMQPIEEKLALLGGLEESRAYWLKVLSGISQRIPQEVWLAELSVEEVKEEGQKEEQREERRAFPEGAVPGRPPEEFGPRGRGGMELDPLEGPGRAPGPAPEAQPEAEPEVPVKRAVVMKGKTAGDIPSVGALREKLAEFEMFEKAELIYANEETATIAGAGPAAAEPGRASRGGRAQRGPAGPEFGPETGPPMPGPRETMRTPRTAAPEHEEISEKLVAFSIRMYLK